MLERKCLWNWSSLVLLRECKTIKRGNKKILDKENSRAVLTKFFLQILQFLGIEYSILSFSVQIYYVILQNIHILWCSKTIELSSGLNTALGFCNCLAIWTISLGNNSWPCLLRTNKLIMFWPWSYPSAFDFWDLSHFSISHRNKMIN